MVAMRAYIYFIHLQPRSGSEQAGTRPCVIVSSNSFNLEARWNSLTIVPITSSQRWFRHGPTIVLLSKGEANLPKDSVALAHQITTIDRSKIIGEAIGQLSETKMLELEQAILNYLEISIKAQI